jgi:hypothetical protein
LTLLVDYGRMPLAGGFLTRDELAGQESYPLRLARCRDCTLMQVLDAVPADTIFRQYSYQSSTTRTLCDHFAQMAVDLVTGHAAAGRQ